MLIVPVADRQPRLRRPPYAVLALIALNIACFFLTIGDRRVQIEAQEQIRQEMAAFKCRLFIQLNGHELGFRPDRTPELFCDEHTNAVDKLWEEFRASKKMQSVPLAGRYEALQAEWNRRTDALMMNRFALDGSGVSPLRSLTALFFHERWWHLLVNCLLLFMVGAMLEEALGVVFFLPLFFVSGFGGNVLLSLLYRGGIMMVVGATTALFGLVGAFIPRFWKTGFNFLFYPLPRKLGKPRVWTLPIYTLLPLWVIQEIFTTNLRIVDGLSAVWMANLLSAAIGFAAMIAYQDFVKKPADLDEEKDVALIEKLRNLVATWRAKISHPPKLNFEGRLEKVQKALQESDPLTARQEAAMLAADLLAVGNLDLLGDLTRLFLKTEEATPIPDRAYARLASHYIETNIPKLALIMLQELDRFYPQSPLAPKALLQQARVLQNSYKDTAGASEKLQALTARYPDHPLAEEARRLQKQNK